MNFEIDICEGKFKHTNQDRSCCKVLVALSALAMREWAERELQGRRGVRSLSPLEGEKPGAAPGTLTNYRSR